MSKPVQLHRWQPTKLRGPWGSPGKNTGVGCHFLLQLELRHVHKESITHGGRGFPDGSVGKEFACTAGDTGDAARSLGREDPLEKGKATHSNILPWRISWTV